MRRTEEFERIGRTLGERLNELFARHIVPVLDRLRQDNAELRQKLQELQPLPEQLLVLDARIKTVEALPPGRDGIDGKDGAPGADGKDGIDGIHGKDGIPGRDGKDALEMQVIGDLDPAKSYPRGTVAAFRGGLVRAVRRSTPIGDDLEAAGWSVLCRGIATTEITPSDDLRTLRVVITHTDGHAVERTLQSPALIYREIYREGTPYARGDAVTWAGSLWIAQCDTTAKPGDGSPDWRLAVKKGRDGRDAK